MHLKPAPGERTEQTHRNKILEKLSPTDYERLAPTMQRVKLDYKEVLIEPNRPIEHVYFVEGGVVSLVTDLQEGGVIESGTIGNESMVGTSVVLGVTQSPSRQFVQIPGEAVRMPAQVIADERRRGGVFAEALLRITHATIAMLSQCVACNRAHAVEQRMSRWLLMTHDRVDAPDFPLTQEFLAQMLGVHRPAVNIAGGALQRAGLIRYSRGKITIVNRQGLEQASCECYEVIRREFTRALGS